jgi:phytoene synthase
MIRGGSRSFYVASLLLPKRLRVAAYAVYGFCRLSDDAIDDLDNGGMRDAKTLMAAKLRAVSRLRARLDQAYRGVPQDNPVDRALADVVRQFHIPQSLFEALLEGFEWDALGRRYESLSALEAYAARVAGTVGAIMAVLMGVRDPARLARACDLGVAMQLTNIARDIGEDARMGRLYLPRDWLKQAGIAEEAFLAVPRCTPQMQVITRKLLARAEVLYKRADSGIAALPADCRLAIRTARLLYAEIGHALARNGCDSVASRTVTSATTKLKLALRAYLPVATPSASKLSDANRKPLAATRFLVEAVQANPRPGAMPNRGAGIGAVGEAGPAASLDSRVGKVFDLLIALHQRELRGQIVTERPRRGFGVSGPLGAP